MVNDYVGPTRLQWTRAEVDYARRFLDAHAAELHVSGAALRNKSPVDRLRQMIRDPSEAPQSDRIMKSFQERCGAPMRPLGGAMIHICTKFLPRDESNDLYADLIDWDRKALAEGLWHFAFGLWKKPA